MKAITTILLITGLFLLTACTSAPGGITPVKNFNLEQYKGKWYEIARLDHSFEEGMEQVTATYTVNDDGTVKVLNKGFITEEQKWDEAQGLAKFVEGTDTGHFKVSFFGPFYGAYVIFELDQDDYQYAFITSYNRDFLWFLSRTPTVSDKLKQHFIAKASKLGFATEQVIWVKQ
ncbi:MULTISPECIES: lipocalin family protein [unclassified Pseudoalteromonas]|uniref:lipocalin family protein n=1 Tax=unclassified Pseudoalteromonas TaxID=194690 RepID=UPI00110A7014|nr:MULTISPECIES: lipocalin family protein [unclassified Pseudoalteromonas]MDC9508554.1 lipocalin family protein [Pseudoalteromonas sp. Angola-4]TMO09899.1 lipocalin [Pseudoalteromonas sp. S327]TMO14925.1 lipocalin [Pseudoalteromonas sp. S326]